MLVVQAAETEGETKTKWAAPRDPDRASGELQALPAGSPIIIQAENATALKPEGDEEV